MSVPSQSTIQRWWEPRCTGPFLRVTLNGGGRVTVRPAIGDAVMALDACLRQFNYRTRVADTGAYNCRRKVGGNGWSMHAYATAVDINWTTNPFGPRLVTDMPPAMTAAIVNIRTMNGAQVWQWGGLWRGNKDAMHFEIVCSPAAIATGIDPRTVPGHRLDPLPVPLPPKQSEEDNMAFLRGIPSGRIYHVYGERFRHLTPTMWNRRRFLGAQVRAVSDEELDGLVQDLIRDRT